MGMEEKKNESLVYGMRECKRLGDIISGVFKIINRERGKIQDRKWLTRWMFMEYLRKKKEKEKI